MRVPGTIDPRAWHSYRCGCRFVPRLAAALLMLPGLFFAGLAPTAERARSYLDRHAEWFISAEGRRIADNVVSYQSPAGSWPKNTDCITQPFTGDRRSLHGTFDNAATTDELRLLARAVRATGEARYGAAFLKGLDHILRAQYANGGWPQSSPAGEGYDRYITFNDGAMVRLMQFLREVATADLYDFVGAAPRQAAQAAFDRGIECILHCQVRVEGKLTVWCAQHNEHDLQPRPARSFELASLSGSESVGVTRLLMSLSNPSPEVVRAVDAAVAWFKASKLVGLRQDYRDDPQAPNGRDKIVVRDPQAGPLWARFYDLKTNRPIFADRDGVPREHLSDIGYERRNGYAWLGDWPQQLIEVEYPRWAKEHHAER